MNKAEAKAVVTIPMKGRYFLHKNGSIIPVTDLINAIYLMTGDEKIKHCKGNVSYRNHSTKFLETSRKSESNQIVLSHAQHRVSKMCIGRSQRLCGTA